MSISLQKSILQTLLDPQSVKFLLTCNRQALPHATFLKKIEVTEEGSLIVLAQDEFSPLNQELLYSLWFDQWVTLNLQAPDGRVQELALRPQKCLITGPVFSHYYQLVRQEDPRADLASVWLLTPEQVHDYTEATWRKRAEEEHPFFLHLDRIAKG